MDDIRDSDSRRQVDAGDDVVTETWAIVRTGTVWLAAVIVAAALLLGPSVAAGWRPSDLPSLAEALWWLGALTAVVGTAFLVWAGCPVPAFTPERAHAQKVLSIRLGIGLSLFGMVFAGFVVLLSPAA